MNTTFYDDALQAFDVYATRMLFDNIYLVADFEMYNNDRGLIKHTISLDSDLEYVPFVILEEFHINDTPNRRNIVCNN